MTFSTFTTAKNAILQFDSNVDASTQSAALSHRSPALIVSKTKSVYVKGRGASTSRGVRFGSLIIGLSRSAIISCVFIFTVIILTAAVACISP